MDYQLGDHICSNASFSSPGSKSQKHSHEDDSTKMSKKLKEDISDKTAYFNCRQEVNVLSQNCAQNLEDCSNLLEESTVRNDSKSHELSGSSNGDSLPKMEAELDDAPQTTHFITGKNSPQSYIQSQEIGLLQPNHLKSASNQSVSLCTPDNFEASSKKNSEAQNLQPNRKGFWEALKVHIERPHILNRRLCGVVDIWWGCTSCCSRPEQPGSTSASVGSMQNLLCNGQEVESSDQMKVSLGDALFDIARSTWSVLNSNRDSDLPLGTEISISNTLLRSDLKLTALERKVITDLQERGFKVFDGKEPLVETCTALGSGNESCYVVVRRVLPKLQERYASVTEVIIMDGRSKNCCFLSEVTVPPLLPARPYVINCRDCPLTATDSSIECSTAGSAVQSAALPHSDVTAANNAGDDGTATPDAVCGGNDGTATPGAGCGGDGTVGTAASSDVAADAASETVNDSSCECQKSSFQQLSMNPSGFFQCSFIAGICENTTGDASKGDGRVWLEGTVLPRLQKWALPRKSQEPRTRSLQLIDLQAYGVMYHKLKSKYAAHFIQSWSERTDPKKFVHEDIGIATYLLLLWSELSRPQRFVDLGCGNGLLVYILTKEGHVGAGYDIKRRNIWHERFSDIDLQEREVRPDTTTLSADVDWLIGNHSDELTPWLPVMAARCSQSCSFFLLPCCPHDFTTKFLRRNSNKSQYGDYLDYVSEVGRVCGFEMERDRLKIPSTKRECFVGRKRWHSEQDRPAVLAAMQQFIDARVAQFGRKVSCGTKKGLLAPNVAETEAKKEELASLGKQNDSVGVQPKSTQPYGLESVFIGKKEGGIHARNDDLLTKLEEQESQSGFIVRPKEQRVRNCTQLAKGVKEDLVKCVVDFLLRGNHVKTGEWSQGTCTELRSAAGMLKPEQLRQIKQECGGLKTLLKNHRHVFLVEGSTVRLRVPGRVPEFEKRQRPCWFSVHHPQGCPNTAAECMYCH